MSRGALLWIGVIGSATLLLAAVEWKRLAAAEGEVRAAQTRLLATTGDVEETLRLRAAAEQVLTDERPEQDLAARVNAVRDAVAIRRDAFTGQRPIEDGRQVVGTAADGRPLRRQRVRFTLTALAVPEIGAFLTEWRRTQPMWTLTKVDLTRGSAKMQDDRYDASIEVAAVYVEAPGTTGADQADGRVDAGGTGGAGDTGGSGTGR